MRLATFNVLHGQAPEDGQVSTERLVAACASLDADVLCLQEVDRGQARSGMVDQTAAIAEGMGAVAWRFVPALVGEPGAVWRPATDDDLLEGEAGYGVALVSRLPVREWHIVRLAPAKLRSPVYVPGGGLILLDDEPRVGLAAEVELPGPGSGGGSLLVATTHLSFVPGWNLAQLRRLTRALAELSEACVLLGDLNVPTPFARAPGGWQALVRAKTFPAPAPSMQIDHVLGRGRLPRVVGGGAHLLPLSDHRAVTVDLAG
ncbi:MAG TPA: endonuclease/exonuclease/phosphatase family protein [Acidimicrobiales bacterium]